MTAQIRKQGRLVMTSGRVTSTSGNIAVIPAALRPGRDFRRVVAAGTSGSAVVPLVYSAATGMLLTAATVNANLDGVCWLVDA